MRLPKRAPGAGLRPLRAVSLRSADESIRLGPPRLAVMTDEELEELIELLAEMLATQVEIKALPLRRAA